MAVDFAKLIELNQKIDAETALLLTRFVVRALQAPNTNEYLKAKLKQALDEPPPGQSHG